MVRHRPAHDPAAPDIQDHREVEESGPCRDIGDVRHPQLVRTVRDELAIDQVRRWPRIREPQRGRRRPAPAHACERLFSHESADPFRSHALSGFLELGMHARAPVRPARALVNGVNACLELGITLRTPARRTLPPRVVPAGGDLQHAAHRGDRVPGLVRSHEPEDFGGIASVSRANQAAAFARIARSSRSVRFSRRSLASSSFSAVVRPS